MANNVGGGGAGRESSYEISVNEFERVFQMNVFSMWRLCQLLAPYINLLAMEVLLICRLSRHLLIKVLLLVLMLHLK
ncbi:hypothetical protein [Empedobacter falsenii]|uniref:hypothetical protein n=1 Tax=Empedobacter falsenii TaxID=343874 RepID=UPI0021ADA108|nr:hypothetical protein [Empedobacter falsenii]